MTSEQPKHSKDILNHWGWAVPILLIVAVLAIRQVDLYPPTQDEFYSMYNAGWLVNGPYSPIDVIQSIQQHSPDHVPGYFILLSVWGNLTAYDIVLGRIFTIFTGLLSLAMAYRLARDFVAPVAGLLMLIVVSSNVFYNYYIPFVRFYPLVVFTSGAVLWMYLRIMFRVKSPKALDYFALFAAVFALENIHLFCATFLAALGIYHLLFAPKNRRWLAVTATGIAALVLFLPVLVNMASGLTLAAQKKTSASLSLDGMTTLGAWINLMLNDWPGLLIAAVVGLLIGFWHKRISAASSYLLLSIIFLLILTFVAEFSGFIRLVEMRYHLAGMLPFALAVTVGLYGLYSFRHWLGLLALLWIVAGVGFQTNGDWREFVADQLPPSPLPPWQVISRLVSRAEQKPQIIGYRLKRGVLERTYTTSYSQKHYYFDRHSIELKLFNNPETFGDYVRQHGIALPSVWVVYQTSATMPHEASSLQTALDELDYQLCDTLNVAVDTVILQYAWDTLNCRPPQLAASYQTDIIDYQFYGAALDTAESKLYFNDQWTATGIEAPQNYKMSYQLITSDWNNVAQLDLPLVHEGQLRLFSIDVSNVPAGAYHLMAIVYDKDSGERQDWSNSAGGLSNMLTLAEIVIPVK